MIVYVESNFVLELAFLQSEHREYVVLIESAERGEIQLVVRAFSIAEPYDTLTRRAKQRGELLDRLRREVRELSRSEPHSDLDTAAAAMTAVLATSATEEKARLDAALTRLLATAEVVPVTAATLTRAIDLQVEVFDRPHDAIVYASVLDHLSACGPGEKLFLNRNTRDFLKPEIQAELQGFECKLLSSFADGVGYLRRGTLPPTP